MVYRVKKSLTAGTLIIIFAGLIIKSIGFTTRLIISNTVGAEGLGLYQLFFPFYALVILTITSGITIAQSGLISQEVAKNRWQNVKKITTISFALTFIISLLTGIIIYLASDVISINIFKDDRLTLSVRYFAPFIPLISIAAVLRGYFYGIGNLGPTGIAGIVEQIARIAVILWGAMWALKFGLEYACLVLVAGLVAGEFANFIVLFIHYIFKKNVNVSVDKTRGTMSILHEIIRISGPASMNRFFMSVLGAGEMILIKNALINSGLEYNFSLEEFGRLTGMAMPLLFFPMVLTNAVATTMVPAISEAIALDDTKKCRMRISKALLFSISSGLVFTAVFMAYPNDIGRMIYRSERVGDMIKLMAFSCTFMYLQQTLTGILNGLARQGVLLLNTFLGFVIRYGAIFLLIPVMGINGYIYGFIAGSFVVCVFNFSFLSRKVGIEVEIGKWIFRPIVVAGFLVFSSDAFRNIFRLFSGNSSVVTLISIVTLVILGYFLMFLFNVLDKKEFFAMLPFKKKKI